MGTVIYVILLCFSKIKLIKIYLYKQDICGTQHDINVMYCCQVFSGKGFLCTTKRQSRIE